MKPTAFAFFDFDDTLTRGDSILPYLIFCIRRGLAPKRQFLKAAAAFIRWKLQPSTGRAAKETTLSYIAGRSVDEMDEVARAFFREAQQKRFFREGVQELEQLRQRGVTTVVVSASSDVYMRILPEFLPVDHVLCTSCNTVEGRYTGKVGKNCKGDEKVRRIEAWLKDEGLSIDRAASSGYGDSPSDAPMILLTGSAHLVNPKKKLLKLIPDGCVHHWD